MNKSFLYSFLFIILTIIIVSCLNPSLPFDYSNYGINPDDVSISEKGYVWPLPGLYRISSYFGLRESPTNFASTYHSGLDIPAEENTYFLATISGTITYTGFNGSGGYTIILENDNISVSYCHVSPNFLVKKR